jgi:hypothetical protein
MTSTNKFLDAIVKSSLAAGLPDYEIKWESAGVVTTAFGTEEHVSLRFVCIKRDRSFLTEEQLEVLNNREQDARKS